MLLPREVHLPHAPQGQQHQEKEEEEEEGRLLQVQEALLALGPAWVQKPPLLQCVVRQAVYGLLLLHLLLGRRLQALCRLWVAGQEAVLVVLGLLLLLLG